MKVGDIPQDNSPGYEHETRAVYAVDGHGRYTVATSTGWEAEEVVNGLAVEEFSRLADEARAACARGEASPLAVHMYRRRMDPPTLAQATGLWHWRVRRHLRPGPFAALRPALRARYAEALGVSAEQVSRLPEEPT